MNVRFYSNSFFRQLDPYSAGVHMYVYSTLQLFLNGYRLKRGRALHLQEYPRSQPTKKHTTITSKNINFQVLGRGQEKFSFR
jgi:hypothetical protein